LLGVVAIATLALLPLEGTLQSATSSPAAATQEAKAPKVFLSLKENRVTTAQRARAKVVVAPQTSVAQRKQFARVKIVIKGGGKTRTVVAAMADHRKVVGLPKLPKGFYKVRAEFLGNQKLDRAQSKYKKLTVVKAAGAGGAPGAFPGPSNTGVPAGTALHACAGNITKAGNYDACEFSGDVRIQASGVTISRSLIHGQVMGAGDNMFGAVIRDTEIDCGCLSQGSSDPPVAIQYDNFTLTRVNIHGAGHGVAMGSNVTVQDSWIHGLGGNTSAHKDGIYVGNGTHSVIQHNTITCNDGSAAGCTAAIGLLTDFGPISYFTIDNNLLNTNGSYCFYGEGGATKPYTSDHVTFTNNQFGREVSPKCGFYGPVTYFDSSAPGNVWTGNTWADTGSLVKASY